MYLNFNNCSLAPQPHVPCIFLLFRDFTLKSAHLDHHGSVAMDSTNAENDYYDDCVTRKFDSKWEVYNTIGYTEDFYEDVYIDAESEADWDVYNEI